MTVTYTAEVATSRGFGCFWRLLLRWRGSIYKLVWPDLCVYLLAYYVLNLLYRFALSDDNKLFFEQVCVYCGNFADLIPVSFVLGFYVSVVVKRWWDCFSAIPWPDSLAFFVSTFLHGQDERGRLMRRTIMRYANLSSIITLRCISPPVKKRFPTLDHLVDAGLLLGNEREVFEQLKTNHSTYWMPLVWASSIASRARKEGRIRDDFALKTVVDEIARYRGNCGSLFNYDWISIPLVYTQVTTLAVYTFFLATLFGSQGLNPEAGYKGHEIDLYVPIFNFLRFSFYMGWLKVAETLVNPFGEDDDDFEMNYVIDRNIQVSYLVVDEMHQNHPELLKDQYWNEVLAPELPYTLASSRFYCFPHQGSTACMIIPPGQASVVSRDKLAGTPQRIDKNQGPEDEEGRSASRGRPVPKPGTVSRGGSMAAPPWRWPTAPSWAGRLSRLIGRRDSSTTRASEAPSMRSDCDSDRTTERRAPFSPEAGSINSRASTAPASPRPLSADQEEDIFRLSDLFLAGSRAQSSPREPSRRASREGSTTAVSPGVNEALDLSSGNEGNIARSSSTEPSTVLYMDAGSSADEGQEHSDLEEDPRTPSADTPHTENANNGSSSLSTTLSKAMPIPSSGPPRSLGHGGYAATHSGRDHVRSGRPRRSTSLDRPSMPGDIYELKKRLRQHVGPVAMPGRESVQDRSRAHIAGTHV
ncbi:bestrophin-4-like isoform X1 [Dermacentor andersoni]|uniref:bestrophin-4-like isoform X1 n=1 Tax=Dermacentor andersoni TaxID=34620 RepID=UPI002154FBBB|nr:bestrophin-4-like isoform X1 [Dermacentor andersoni]